MDPSVGILTAVTPGLALSVLAAGLYAVLARWFDPVPRRVIAVHGLAVLILFGSSLFLGYLQLPLQILRGTQPLTFVQPADHPGIVLQADVIEDFFPYMLEVRRAYAQGQWPLLHPLVNGGEPLLANTQAQAFHPLTLATLPLPLERAYAVISAGKTLCALTFAFLWLRRCRFGASSAVAGSAVFGMGGFVMSWLGWPHVHSAIGLMIILYALEGLFQDRRRRWELMLVFGTLWVLFGGHPQTTLLAAMAAGIWTIGLVLRQRLQDPSLRSPVATLSALMAPVGPALCAALLAAPLLLPAALWVPNSARYQLTQESQHRAPGAIESIRAVASSPDAVADLESRLRVRTGMIAGPLAFGSNELYRFWGHQNLIEDGAQWAGTLTLLSVAMCLFLRLRRRPQSGVPWHTVPWRPGERPALLLVAIGYLMSLEIPGLHQGFEALPIIGRSVSNPSRCALLIAAGSAYLVALLVQRLIDHASLSSASRRSFAVRAMLAGAVTVTFVLWAYLGNPPPEGPTSQRLLEFRARTLFLHVAVLLAALAAFRRPSRPATWTLVALVFTELLFVHYRLHRAMPTRMFFPSTEATQFLQDNLQFDGEAGLAAPRMVGTGSILLPNLATVYGIPDARSSNPLRSDLIARLDAPLRSTAIRYRLPDHPLYDLFGIRYVLRRQWAAKPELPVRVRERVAVFERPGAMPIAWLPKTLLAVAGDHVSATQQIQRFGRFAVVGEDTGLARLNRRRGDRVTALAADRDRVVVEVTVAAPALVATRISNEPGSWRALVNGEPTTIIPTNAAMIGVPVPEGTSTIELVYRPRGLLFGSLLAGMGMALLIGRAISAPSSSPE